MWVWGTKTFRFVLGKLIRDSVIDGPVNGRKKEKLLMKVTFQVALATCQLI
jgi:hypothetical protein